MNEFEFIENIKNRFGLGNVGDDAAVLPKSDDIDMVVTADLLVQDVDFHLKWASPELLGQKALAVSLSDIAAMGAEPRWAMLSVGVPEPLWNSKFLERFYDGWHDMAAIFEVDLVGGDISRSQNVLFFDSIVGGDVPKGKAVFRSGAKPGDAIYVSGPLGAAAAGLKLLESGEKYTGNDSDPRHALILKQLRPLPQVRLGLQLREKDLATSMIDISDGLSSDLAHICNASGVGAVINANDIPFEAELMNLAGSVDTMLNLTLNGGEDFELLFTADEEKISRAGITDIFRIGAITPNAGVIELNKGGHTALLPPRGHRHF